MDMIIYDLDSEQLLCIFQRDVEAPHSSEPQKAHPTGEFVVVA